MYGSFTLLLLFEAALSQFNDLPVAHSIRRAPIHDRPRGDVRRMPMKGLLSAIGPIALGKKDGDDIKYDVPNMGNVGVGTGKTNIMKFVPEGSEGQKPNFGSWNLGDKPNLGYMEHDTTIGRESGTKNHMSLAGLGSFISEQNVEKGTGLLDFSKALFPFLELPPPKSTQQDPKNLLTPEEQKLAEIYYPKPKSYLEGKDLEELDVTAPPQPFDEKRVTSMEDDREGGNPFDKIKKRPYFNRFKVHAAQTVTEDSDLVTKPDSPFDKEDGVVKKPTEEDEIAPRRQLTPEQIGKSGGVSIPISQLGLNEKQVYELCAKFAPVAAKFCYGTKIDPRYVDRCRGYFNDCRKFQAESKPLGAIANSFNSGVGLTYYDWGVNGIPYYAVNEEGGIGNGHNGKIDFGSWGGGYSDELGIRDFWSQRQEYGANWYEGVYGWKNSWGVPLGNSMGVEGSSGSQVSVPLKEGDFGKPLQVSNGYSVGPYLALADRTLVDWYNGGVSSQRGFSVPFVGVGVTSGAGIGFPSVGTLMKKMSLNGMGEAMELMSTHSSLSSTGGLGMSTGSSLAASGNGITSNSHSSLPGGLGTSSGSSLTASGGRRKFYLL